MLSDDFVDDALGTVVGDDESTTTSDVVLMLLVYDVSKPLLVGLTVVLDI